MRKFLSSQHKQWNYGHPTLLFIGYLLVVGLDRLLPACIARATYRLFRAVGIASDGAGYVLYLRIGVVGLLGAVVQALDYLTPLLGTKYSGGSRAGNWGCILGTIAGIFLFAPWGIILGPFIGALVGELIGGKPMQEALRAGMGAFIGFLLSVVLKVALCGYFCYEAVAGFIQ